MNRRKKTRWSKSAKKKLRGKNRDEEHEHEKPPNDDEMRVFIRGDNRISTRHFSSTEKQTNKNENRHFGSVVVFLFFV